MTEERTAIGPWLLFPLLVLPTLGFGLLNYPYYAAGMSAGGCLTPAVAAAMSLPGLAAIHSLARRFPGRTIAQYGISVLGPAWGRGLGLAFLLPALAFLAIGTRDLLNLLLVYLAPRTPFAAAMLPLFLIGAFLASRGIETISRLASFLLIPAYLVILFLTILGFQNVSSEHLRPVLGASLRDYAAGGFSALYIYCLFGCSAYTSAFLDPSASFPRFAAGALAVLTLVYVALAVGTIGTFGRLHLRRLSWPAVEFIHAIEYPFLLLEQAGLLFLIDWTALIVLGTGFLCYVIALGVAQLTGFLDYKKLVWILAAFIMLLALLLRSVAETKALFDLTAKIAGLSFFVHPILIWLVDRIRRRIGHAP